MTPLYGDDREANGNIASHWSDAENHDYYGRGSGNSYVQQGLPDAPTKSRKRSQANTTKLKESATKHKVITALSPYPPS
ncbi:unnamed protein product [Protopolystoma xenopodis]|uniref:Uncharacterized protein n=1 Tax=Protopolystoma xenopodis TaxID=117903 RepID=A0A3S5CPJ3_9PLAT|nr:unnamed protein product [Protopolystoma xenopodis]